MPGKVNPIPDGYTSVTPYLICDDASAAIEFYRRAFGALELVRMPMPDGKVAHAEMQVGNARIMLSDESPEWGTKSPRTLGGSSSGIVLYVDDADAVTAAAIAAGATVKRPIQDQFYGDRSASVTDPFGHEWNISTHIEDVSEEEMQRRMAAMPQS